MQRPKKRFERYSLEHSETSPKKAYPTNFHMGYVIIRDKKLVSKIIYRHYETARANVKQGLVTSVLYAMEHHMIRINNPYLLVNQLGNVGCKVDDSKRMQKIFMQRMNDLNSVHEQ